MKKLTLLLALVLALSCLLIACDSADANETTTVAETTAATTEAPTEEATEAATPEQTTEAATEAPSTKVTYTVTVKDQDGNPVEGAAVQMCDDNGCKMPAATNAEGVVTFTYDPSNYHITIVECPAGYTCDPEQAFYFEGESTELTVEITKD